MMPLQRNTMLANVSFPIFVLLFHFYLAFNHVIGNDEGVALYTGRVVLEGGAPYLDSWDHKGPILYFLNAAGFWISQGATWGPAMMEGLLLAFAVTFLVHQLKNFWPSFVINSVLIGFLLSYYFFMESLNLTESWTLGFQIIAYLLIWKESNRDSEFASGKRAKVGLFFSLGLVFSIIFYTRPNNSMGVLFATLTFIFLLRDSSALKGLVVFILTFFSFSTLILSYLRATDSLAEFIEQFIIYNFDYSSAGSLTNRLDTASHSLFRLAQTPLIMFLVVIIIFTVLNKSICIELVGKLKMNVAICVGLLADFFFSFLSARGYLHYMIIILPGLMFVIGILQCHLAETSLMFRRVTTLVLVTCVLLGGFFGVPKVLNRFHSDPGNLEGVSKFLNINSTQSDRIQVLGSDTRVLVVADRKSSSNITYSHPATSVFYRNAKLSISKIEDDVKSEMPKFIVRSINGTCEFNVPDCGLGKPDYNEGNLAPLYSWILRHYQMIEVIGNYEIWQLSKL